MNNQPVSEVNNHKLLYSSLIGIRSYGMGNITQYKSNKKKY